MAHYKLTSSYAFIAVLVVAGATPSSAIAERIVNGAAINFGHVANGEVVVEHLQFTAPVELTMGAFKIEPVPPFALFENNCTVGKVYAKNATCDFKASLKGEALKNPPCPNMYKGTLNIKYTEVNAPKETVKEVHQLSGETP